MEEVLTVPDNIPQDLLDKAECVIVIPSTMTVALGVGGSMGRGAMVCRMGKSFNGAWGAPAMYTLQGGSIGLQLDAESTDPVLLVMNPRGVDALLDGKVKLGIAAQEEPVLLRLGTQLIALHEAPQARTAAEHLFGVERAGLAAIDAITQPIGRLSEALDRRTDVGLPAAGIVAAVGERPVEALVEPLGLLPDGLQQLLDLVVVDPGRRVLRGRAPAPRDAIGARQVVHVELQGLPVAPGWCLELEARHETVDGGRPPQQVLGVRRVGLPLQGGERRIGSVSVHAFAIEAPPQRPVFTS